jgi:phosphomannomutase / phosphoglucomutase
VSIYKACDIRGDAERQLTPELYQRWGRALGRRVAAGSPFIVGGDVRTSTPVFLDALVEGLMESGMEVTDLGILPTPMVYFAQRTWQTPACTIVTASHSPAHINGLKWMIGAWPPDEAEVQALRRDAEGDSSGMTIRGAGSRRRLDISAEYRSWLEMAFRARQAPASQRIVLDPGNGCWSERALDYLRRLFPHVAFSAIHDRPDGTFPDRHPDCARPEYLQRLAETVCSQSADLGVAFDGDGDRVALVDHEGVTLTAEESTHILLHSLERQLPDSAFVHDVKFSDRIAETARQLGARSIAERSGHAFIRRSMIERRAVFGAEISGHYFFRDLHGADDGLFTACWLISHLAESGRTLAALRRRCPPIFMTADMRLSVPPEEQGSQIQQVSAAFRQLPQSFVDGVRVDFPGGWALVRQSVTEAALTFRFEGEDPERLGAIVNEFCKGIGNLGNELVAQYETTVQSKTSHRCVPESPASVTS